MSWRRSSSGTRGIRSMSTASLESSYELRPPICRLEPRGGELGSCSTRSSTIYAEREVGRVASDDRRHRARGRDGRYTSGPGATRRGLIDDCASRVKKGHRGRARVQTQARNGNRSQPRPISLLPEHTRGDWEPDVDWIEERLELMLGADPRGAAEELDLELRLAAFERDLILEDHARARDEADRLSRLEIVRARNVAQFPDSSNLQRNQEQLFSPDPETDDPNPDIGAVEEGLDADRQALFPAAAGEARKIATTTRIIEGSRRRRRAGRPSLLDRRLRRARMRRRRKARSRRAERDD